MFFGCLWLANLAIFRSSALCVHPEERNRRCMSDERERNTRRLAG
jgi:hypothetical protein